MTKSLFACILRAIVVVGLICGVCAAAAPVSAANGSFVQRGTASFYADKFHGRRTASGEILDQNAFTAASKTLPLGTRVRVTNLGTGKSVRVRINDRGSFAPGRIIDLSKGAAAALGLGRRQGVALVLVEAHPGDQPTPELRRKISAAAAQMQPPLLPKRSK